MCSSLERLFLPHPTFLYHLWFFVQEWGPLRRSLSLLPCLLLSCSGLLWQPFCCGITGRASTSFLGVSLTAVRMSSGFYVLHTSAIHFESQEKRNFTHNKREGAKDILMPRYYKTFKRFLTSLIEPIRLIELFFFKENMIFSFGR